MKLILLGLLSSTSFANETFIDLIFGHSLGTISYGYTQKKSIGSGYSYYPEELEYNLGIKAGQSIEVIDILSLEPSIGATTSFLTNIYYIELPVLYKYKIIKFGPLIRYNYLTNIGIKYLGDTVKIEDKNSYSIGIKAVIVTSKVDFLFSYEYMLNAVYDDVSTNNNIRTSTHLDMQGVYFSSGIRVKF